MMTASGDSVAATWVVVTAGAWSVPLLGRIGVDIPVRPYVRTEYVVSTPFHTAGLPSIFLPNGVHVLSESENLWVIGWSRSDDPVSYEFSPASREHFERTIWPALVEYLPAFDRLHVERSWAGLYAVNEHDQNAILGPWPAIPNLLLATGFSGHGLQQAPAVGRYLAESILGLPHPLDLTRLGAQRIMDGTRVREHARAVDVHHRQPFVFGRSRAGRRDRGDGLAYAVASGVARS